MKNKTTSLILTVVSVLCAVSVVLTVIALIVSGKPDKTPPFYQLTDDSVMGYPSVTDEQQLYIISNCNQNFQAYVCRNALIKGKTLSVGFTNPAESRVLMQLYIYGENGRYLGKSGLLKEENHIMDVQLERKPKDGEVLTYKVVCYEYDTYYSAGVAVGEGIAVEDL